jgi:diguanylate cyclase (GGDEF)-like protein
MAECQTITYTAQATSTWFLSMRDVPFHEVSVSTHNENPPKHSLVQQLTRQNLQVLWSSMLLSFVLIALTLWLTARDRQASAAELAAIQLANNVSAMLAFDDPVEAHRELALLASHRELSAIALYHADGRLFASVRQLSTPAKPFTDVDQLRRFTTPQREFLGLEVELTVPILVQNNVEGVLILREKMHKLLRWFLQGVLLMSVLMLVIFFIAARILIKKQKQALSPLLTLSALAEQVAMQRNFRLRAPIIADDEIGRLAQRFNELLKRAEVWQTELHDQIQQHAEQGEMYQQLALNDSLTGLANRYAFGLKLQQMLERTSHRIDEQHPNQPPNQALNAAAITATNQAQDDQSQPLISSALLFIDLDNFKYVNDKFGHDAGDAVLIEVSRRIIQGIRQQDTLCRLGGDEFALLVPAPMNASMVAQLCERLLTLIRQPLWWQNQQMPIGLSIGVALYPQHASDSTTLLNRADEAMYAAKRAGKNGYRIYQTPTP